MRTFHYTTWGGNKRVVEADQVEFTGSWVTFWAYTSERGPGPERLVLATKESDVNNLYEVSE